MSDHELVQVVETVEKEYFSDQELLHDVTVIEEKLWIDQQWSYVSNLEILQAVRDIENKDEWGSVTDSEILSDVYSVEDQAGIECGLSDSDLLHDVTIIESSLNHLLQWNALLSPPRSTLSVYQGPGVPVPSLQNEVCVIVQPNSAESCKPVFDLGRPSNWSDDDDCASAPSIPVPREKPANQKKVVPAVKPMRTYNHPRDDAQMDSLANKRFSAETQKKICWVLNMYH